MASNTGSRLTMQYKCIIQESDCVCLSHCDIRQQISEQSTSELQRACVRACVCASAGACRHTLIADCINASSRSASLSSHCLPLTLTSQNKAKKVLTEEG